MVWMYTEQGCWVYRKKEAEDGGARKEEKTQEEGYGCSEGTHECMMEEDAEDRTGW